MKFFIKYSFFLAVAILLSACSGSKKMASKGGGENPLQGSDVQKFQYAFFNANREKMLGNFDKAELYFEQCLSLNKNSDAVIYELARIYELKNEDNKALVFAKKAYELDSKNEWYAFFLANVYEKTSNYKQAAEVYEKLCAEHPDNLEYYYRWANTLIYDNNLKKAVTVFQQIEDQIGVDQEITTKMQKIYLSMGDVDAAIKETEKLIETFPENGQNYSVLADLYLKQKNEEKALEIYQLQLQRDSLDPYVHLSLSEYYGKKGEDEKSHQELLKAFKSDRLSIDPKVRIVLTYFTLIGLKEGEEQHAYELSKALVETHDGDAKSHSVFGDLLYRMDSLEAARNEYRKSAELDDSKYVLWSQIVLLDSELLDYKSMYDDGGKAIELFPSQPAFYLFKGIAALQLKKYEDCISTLNIGKDLVFDNPGMLGQFYSSLGDAYHAVKDYANSDISYDKALEIDPENTIVMNNYSYYLSLRGDSLDKAEVMAKKCVEKEPNSPTYADTYAWVLFKNQKYDQAKKWLEVAIDKGGSKNGVILEHYGDTLFMMNEVDKAVEEWKKANETGTASENIQNKIDQRKIIE